MKKNDEFDVYIDSYASEGQGVARYEGFVVFVPFALKGEKVKVHIIKVNKNFAVGKIVEILEPSKERVLPKCPFYKKCGGCQLQHTTYENGLDIKRLILKDSIERIGDFKNINVKNTIKSDKIYNYRNKSAFPVVVDLLGRVQVSMFKNLSHEPVFIDSCLIADEMTNKMIKVFEEFANKLTDEEKAGLKFVVIRVISNKVLFTIVSLKPIKNAKVLFDMLKNELNLTDESLGLFWCKKDIDNNVILEGELKHIGGIKRIETSVNDIEIGISPLSFFQVNIPVMEKIYREVENNIESDETIVDTYSGAGLMSAMLAKKAKKVYAIEIVKQATEDANEVKKANNLTNLENINGDTKQKLPSLVEKIDGEFSLVLDPPRKGVEEEVLSSIIKSAPKKIIYVSCSPASLSRDLKILSSKYQIDSLQPYDMFPLTHHVETVAVLKRID